MTGWKEKDDKKIRGPKDRNRVSLDEPWEIKHWCEEFGVTEEELNMAVKAVGNLVGDVEFYLNINKIGG